MSLFMLLASYGLCFGLIHKAKFLRRLPVIDKMFNCVYCTGFHTGWMICLLSSYTAPALSFSWAQLVSSAFASAAVCYIIDTAVIFLEERTAQVKRDNPHNHRGLFG